MPGECMIFAAGLGTRMRPLTDRMPKPLIPVGNAPMIAHSLEHLRRAGVSHCVINMHHLHEQIETFAQGVDDPAITLSDERDELLETGGGLVKARGLFGEETIFTANPDAIWTGGNPFATLRSHWDPDRMDALLLLGHKARIFCHKGPGDFFADAAPDRAALLTRRGEATSADFVYISAQIIKLSALNAAPDGPFSLNVIWDQIIARRRLFGCIFPGQWADMGHPEALSVGARMLWDES